LGAGRSRNVTPESNGTSPNAAQKTNEPKVSKSSERVGYRRVSRTFEQNNVRVEVSLFVSSLQCKDKKERVSVSLMRRLTSLKKSRSPPPTSTYSIDNPVFDDSGSSTFIPVAHAR